MDVVLYELIGACLFYLAGSLLIDHFFWRQEEIINRMTEKGDV